MLKIQYPFLIFKSLSKIGMEGNPLNMILFAQSQKEKVRILNDEKLKPLPLKSGISQGDRLSTLFHIA